MNLPEIKFHKRTDGPYEIWEGERDEVEIRILHNTNHPFYSAYAKRYVEEDGLSKGYMEISSNKGTNLAQAKWIADKLCDICLGYKVPGPGKE